MKRITFALLTVALLLGAASAAFGSESSLRIKTLPNVPGMSPIGGMPLWGYLFNVSVADTGLSGKIALSTSATSHTFTTVQKAKFDHPRNAQFTIAKWGGATVNNIKAGTATLTGTNVKGETITETYTISDNTAATTVGTVAFASITSLAVTAMDGTCGCSIGIGNKYGLSTTAPCVAAPLTFMNASATALAAPTIVCDNDEVEKNTIDFATDASAATDDYVFFYIIPPYMSIGSVTGWTTTPQPW